jgi:hypothetical protein
MNVEIITPELLPKLEIFCKEAEELGYNNNSSLEAMKYYNIKIFEGEYFCAIKDDKIVAVAGCHRFPAVNENAWRVMFRGAQLPGHHSYGISKYHMDAITWRDILPAQIEFCDTDELYITTNVEHDASGKMNKIHRLFQNLCKVGLVECYKETAIIEYTEQSVWKLNIDEYNTRRAKVL